MASEPKNVLSSLIACDDDDLEAFCQQRLDGYDVDLVALRQLRDVARALAELLEHPGDPRWRFVEGAWRALAAGRTSGRSSAAVSESGWAPEVAARPRPSQTETLAITTTGTPPMTVAVYAVLCACCGAFPQRIAETHAKFGVPDLQTRTALDLAWREKFAEDPRLQALWTALYHQFRGWLAQHGSIYHI